MKAYASGGFTLAVLAAAASLQPACAAPAGDVATITAPVIPDRMFRLSDYGAVGDGKTMDTRAVQAAVDACSKAGGGTVDVPAGRYLTGPFHLASSLNLRLEKDAVILVTNDIATYPMKGRGYENCITASDCHDLEITGQGTIDGQGQPWWEKYRKRKAPGQSEAVPPDLPHRPFMVVLSRCTRVLIQGVTLENSPSFHLVPESCQDVTIEHVTISAPEDAPNTDGIDPSGWNYLVEGCTFDVGDDCIAVKPGQVQKDGRPSCENFTIRDCAFLHGHGMSIGGQTRGGLRNLVVRDCTFDSTQAGIRLKAPRGAGGLVEDLTYDNLEMKNVKVAILITSYYPRIPKDPGADPVQPVNSLTPIWRHIHINNVTATGSDAAGQIIGLPEMPVSDLVLANVHLSAKKGMEIVHARDIRFVNSTVTPASGRPFTLTDAAVTGIDEPHGGGGVSGPPGADSASTTAAGVESAGTVPAVSEAVAATIPSHGATPGAGSTAGDQHRTTAGASPDATSAATTVTPATTAPPVTTDNSSAGRAAEGAQADGAELLVSSNGPFKTVQDAINAAHTGTPEHPTVIHIRPGTYRERLYVQREKRFVRLLGDDPARTILTYDLYASQLGPDGKAVGTFGTASSTIDADDFSAENVTFENAAGPKGQALAIRLDGDRDTFRNCRFLGWQDTILDNRGRHYYDHCAVNGSVDFIFGGGTGVFDHCDIAEIRDTGGVLTAPSTPQEQPYGLVFLHCRLLKAPGVRPASTTLMRPWREYGMSAFIDCALDDDISPGGWSPWDGRETTCRAIESGSTTLTGQPIDLSQRAPWVHILTPEEAAKYTISNIFNDWNPTASNR